MKYIIFLLINVFSISILSGQDFHFSQLEMSPLHLNPALTGQMEGKHRITIKHRKQWKSILRERHYQTSFLSYDTQFPCINGGNFWSLGLTGVFDEVGTHKFTTYLGNISTAFHLRIAKEKYLSFGVQAGVLSYALRGRNFEFDAQFGATGFNANTNNFENFEQYSTKPALDINVGGLFYTPNFEVGLSVYHFNRPTLSFLGLTKKDDSRVNLRFILHGLVPLPKLHNASLKFLLMAQKITPAVLNWQAVPIFQWKIKFDEEVFGTLGVGGRLTRTAFGKKVVIDAGIISLKFAWSDIILGFSYEFNVSPLAQVSLLRAGPEMSLVWLIGEASGCVICPNSDGFKTF